MNVKDIEHRFINSSKLDFPDSDISWLIERCKKLEKVAEAASELYHGPEDGALKQLRNLGRAVEELEKHELDNA